jgi:DNA-binding response OmpR family regulator
MNIAAAPATIMIIDDEPENLNVLGETLRQNGWNVLAFPGGEMALAAAREEPPDVVLLDIRMPGIDGYEVCRRFKADKKLCAIPILFISALSATQDIVAGFELGGVDYITKPFRQAEVLARVQTHLTLRQAYATLAAEHTRLRSLEHHRDMLTDLLVRDLHKPLQKVRQQLASIDEDAAASTPDDPSDGLKAAIDGTRVLADMIATGGCLNRLVSDGVPLYCLDIPVQELFDSVCTMAFYPAGTDRITTHVSAHSPEVYCDLDLTGRIIANLLANALKNSPNNSPIVLTAGPIPNGVRFWVRDGGVPMPARHQRNFAKLGMVDLPANQQPPSVDLHLFFCKLAVEAQGGNFGVEDSDNNGRNFWFSLPAATTPEPDRSTHTLRSADQRACP